VKRREFLHGGAGAPAVLMTPRPAPRRDNPIIEENRKTGTPDWQLQYTQFEYPPAWQASPLIRGLRSAAIEGFASKTSVTHGESVEFKISVNSPVKVRIDIYRMGYYGGKGGRHMMTLGSFPCEPQETPPMSIQRLRECNWPTVAKLTVPQEWGSGVYLAKLTRQESFGKQSFIIFIVKDHRPTDLLFQCSDLTWQAYNKWPGNDSLYDDGSSEVFTTKSTVRVSFDRPYAKYCQILDAPATAGSGEFLLWEYPQAYWFEKEGYDVTYCSNLDTDRDPKLLTSCKAFLSIAHDEYWTRAMYDNVMAARNRGVSLAFFSGNAVCWEVQTYPDSTNQMQARAYRRKRLFPDEEQLMGSVSYGSGYGDWVVAKPSHWIYEKTGMAAGDAVRGLIGWEYHGTPAAIPGLEVVAEAPLYPPRGWDGAEDVKSRKHPQRHHSVVFPCSNGNWVFNAGTIWWGEGLSQPPGHMPARHTSAGTMGPDERVQQITRNVLDRMIRESRRG
jgi:hypothetical protein